MKTLSRSLTGILIFILIWQIVALLLNKPIIVPSPTETLKTLWRLLADPVIMAAAFQTAWKVFLALGLVLVLGIPAGLLLGLMEGLYDMSRPVIMLIQAVPVISWLSLVLFTWGPSWEGPVLIAFLSLLPMAILTTVSGVRNLDQNLLEMARVYEVDKKKIIKDIYLGSLLPFIIAIIDVSIGHAWKVILVAEYLAGNSGLGRKIYDARYFVAVADMWALTLIAVILGLLTERLIKIGLRRASKKWMPA
jgi:NitT/TauT family transport system permease protein